MKELPELLGITASYDIPGWIDTRMIRELQKLVAGKESVVNIGVWKGRSVAAFAEIVDFVYAVDHFRGSPRERNTNHKQAKNEGPLSIYLEFVTYMKALGLWNKIIPFPLDSKDAHHFFLRYSVDVIFMDASHRYEDLITDLILWHDKIKPGGFICGDDYDWSEVGEAIENFARPFNYILDTDFDNSLWVLRRAVDESR